MNINILNNEILIKNFFLLIIFYFFYKNLIYYNFFFQFKIKIIIILNIYLN